MTEHDRRLVDQTDELMMAISEYWYAENPGWNSGPSRREIAMLALQAMPPYVTKITAADGSSKWVRAVGQYAFDMTMETLDRVAKEAMTWEMRARQLGWNLSSS